MLASISKLYRIFISKEWNSKEGNQLVFENYCHLLNNLDEDQQRLILDLTERYLWVSFNDYLLLLKSVLKQIETNKLEKCKRIIMFPIRKTEHEDDLKSGDHFAYMFKGFGVMTEDKFFKKELNIITQFKNLEEIRLNDSDLLFLVDDYLGSGETINSTLKHVDKNDSIEPRHINVLSLVAQHETIKEISAKGIQCYVAHILKKGITDYYKTPELEDNINIMEQIEKMIPGNHFRFGYNESEALVTMGRTPDNTFPIFWKEHRKNGQKFTAPFSRY